jgi:hypothetical protein
LSETTRAISAQGKKKKKGHGQRSNTPDKRRAR